MSVRSINAARLVPMLGSGLDVTPAYRGLADALRLLVADGRLPAGTRLPSERELSAALTLSRTTVTRAYAELRDRGYLTSRQGSGHVVTLPGSAAGRRQGSSLDPAIDRRSSEIIDLTCASMSAPAGIGRPTNAPWTSSPATSPEPATTRWACSDCASPSPSASPIGACPPHPSRSW